MLNVYAIASHPLGQAALQLAQEEGPKTKGVRAVIGVLLMFGILCGGVMMLLASSFGVKLAYLITSTAFWGCWFVLSILWLTGVPGLKIGPLDIPESTPRFYGPQGSESLWVNLTGNDTLAAKHPLPEESLIEVTDDVPSASLLSEKAAAETAAGEQATRLVAEQLGVPRSEVSVPTIIQVEKTEMVRDGAKPRWARVTFGPAETNASTTADNKALIDRVEPTSVDLYFQEGDLAVPTYISIVLFLVLFGGHAVALAIYEARQAPAPSGAPERQTVAA